MEEQLEQKTFSSDEKESLKLKNYIIMYCHAIFYALSIFACHATYTFLYMSMRY